MVKSILYGRRKLSNYPTQNEYVQGSLWVLFLVKIFINFIIYSSTGALDFKLLILIFKKFGNSIIQLLDRKCNLSERRPVGLKFPFMIYYLNGIR